MVAYTFRKRRFDIIYQNYSASSLLERYTIIIFVQLKLTHVRVTHGNISKRNNILNVKKVFSCPQKAVSRESGWQLLGNSSSSRHSYFHFSLHLWFIRYQAVGMSFVQNYWIGACSADLEYIDADPMPPQKVYFIQKIKPYYVFYFRSH